MTVANNVIDCLTLRELELQVFKIKIVFWFRPRIEDCDWNSEHAKFLRRVTLDQIGEKCILQLFERWQQENGENPLLGFDDFMRSVALDAVGNV